MSKGKLLIKTQDRAIQDPLSFRTQIYAINEALENLSLLKELLAVAINQSEDNPTVLIDVINEDNNEVMKFYNINGSMIIPSANFDYLPISLRIDALNLSLAVLSERITQSIFRLSDPELTKLPRFLIAHGNRGHGFGALEKPIAFINQSIKNHANPQILNSAVLAGNIEDVATYSSISLGNLKYILESFRALQSFELLYATQAIDLRGVKNNLGTCTSNIYKIYREKVPFVQSDRIYSQDLQLGIDLLKLTL